MVEKLTLNCLAKALVDIPAVSIPIAHFLKDIYDKTPHFKVPSTRSTFVMTMLFNELLDMPHLSGGWIILAKEKCSLTGTQTNSCTFESNKLFACMENFRIFFFSS